MSADDEERVEPDDSVLTMPMPALPPQPEGVDWPTREWPRGEVSPDVDRGALGRAYHTLIGEPDRARLGDSRSLLCVHRGRLVAEAYAGEHDGVPYGPETPQLSWSMAKSITHALVGVLIRNGRLGLDDPVALPRWEGAGDLRAHLTIEHLLRMVDGLDFAENYDARGVSHVIEMLFGEGKDDVVAFAADRPRAHDPGRYWNYSSGTSCLVAAVVQRIIGGGESGMREFMRRELFEPLGMRRAEGGFDAAGNFVGSSYVFATAEDYARFGLLYLRDGVWEGRRLLPEGWVDHARRLTPASFDQYGAHWWLAQDRSGIFYAWGFRGQSITVVPTRDLVVVRTGDTDPSLYPNVMFALRDVVEAFPRIDR